MANEFPLVQAAAVTDDKNYSVVVRNMIQEENPILDLLPMVPVPIGNNQHGWFEETSQGTAATRAINGSWTPNYARFIPKTAGLTIFGGELKWDRQIPLLYGDRMPNFLEYQAEAKARATFRKIEETLIEGDPAVDPNAFDGMRLLAAERNMEFKATSGTDRDELRLEQLDEVLDAVYGDPFILGSQWHRRKINALMRAAGQAREMVDGGFGRQFEAYAGKPIVINQRRNDLTTLLGFDEDPGDGGDDASSLYVLNPIGPEEDQGVHCIIGAGSAFEVYGLGESYDTPQEKKRLEATVGFVSKGNRGLARYKGIGQI
jgi:hypothetical protein